MLMNVEKLINELKKIKNKEQYVYVYASEWTNDFEIIQDSDNSIRLDNDWKGLKLYFYRRLYHGRYKHQWSNG